MYHSKLFQLLHTLETSEIRWLHKFLKSPYHNSNPQYLHLFEYIKKYYPNLEHPKLSKEITFKKLYPKETFDPQKMRKLMHELAILVEEFLVIHHIKNNAFEHQKIFIAELGRRNHYKAFEKETNSLLHELEQQEKRGENHFLERYQLRKQLFGHPLTVRGQGMKEELLKISDELDNYFFLQKLNLDIALESNIRIFSGTIKVNLVDEIINQIKGGSKNLSSEIILFQLVNELLRENKEDDFFNHVIEKYKELKSSLKLELRSNLIQSLISFTSKKLNQGDIKFVAKQLIIYKLGLKDKVIPHERKITNNTFSNIISCAAFEKEYDWAEWFLNTYSQYLNPQKRQEIIMFNRGNLYFKKGDFHKALDHLTNIQFNDILYQTNSRVLIIECYFELYLSDETYYDLVISQINSTEKFIRREKKLAKNKKMQLFNFVSIMKKLIKVSFEPILIEKLEHEISVTRIIAVKPWILQKVNSIKKRAI